MPTQIPEHSSYSAQDLIIAKRERLGQLVATKLQSSKPRGINNSCNMSITTTTETVRPWQQLGGIMQPIAAAKKKKRKKKRESRRNAGETAF